MKEDYDVIEVDHYNGVQLRCYDGKYGLLSMQKGQNEVWYKKWVFLSRWSKSQKEPLPDTNKKLPMAVRLGDKQTALNTLKKLIKDLQGV